MLKLVRRRMLLGRCRNDDSLLRALPLLLPPVPGAETVPLLVPGPEPEARRCSEEEEADADAERRIRVLRAVLAGFVGVDVPDRVPALAPDVADAGADAETDAEEEWRGVDPSDTEDILPIASGANEAEEDEDEEADEDEDEDSDVEASVVFTTPCTTTSVPGMRCVIAGSSSSIGNMGRGIGTVGIVFVFVLGLDLSGGGGIELMLARLLVFALTFEVV